MPTSPGYPNLTIGRTAAGFWNFTPTALMVEAKESPTMRLPAGTKIVSVTMYVPAGK
jgi:hypothetical protein